MALLPDLTPACSAGGAGRFRLMSVGSHGLTRDSRTSLAAAVGGLTGQDTAAQVYRSTLAWYFVAYGFGEGIVFGLILLLLRGASRDPPAAQAGRLPGRRGHRRRDARPAASWPGSCHGRNSRIRRWSSTGSAWPGRRSSPPWRSRGPWRRDPLGPPGFVGAALVAVIGIDVITGSHLQTGHAVRPVRPGGRAVLRHRQ